MKKTLTKLLGGALLALFLVPSTVGATITATWDFHGNQPSGIQAATNYGTGVIVNIPSTRDGVQLYVNTGASGKFSMNGGTNYIQMNAGTIARVPVVSTQDVVSIDFAGNSGYCTISSPHTATQAEVEQGYVEIGVSENSTYLNSISVQLAYLPPTQREAKWNFTGSSAEAIAIAGFSGSSVDQTITVSGIDLTVNPHGAATGDNANSIYTGQGATFRVPVVSTNDVITVNGYPGYCEYTIGGGEKTTATKTVYNVTSADVANHYVEIVNCITTSWSYLVSIELTTTEDYFTTATIGDTGWATFSNTKPTDFTNLNGVVEAYIVTGAAGGAISKGDVDATADASTGLLLNADAGTYAIPFAKTGTDYSGTNKLVAGTGVAVNYNTGAGYNYVLAASGANAVFQQIVSGTYGSVVVPAGKAYLALTSAPGARTLSLDDETTGVQELKNSRIEELKSYYDLQGRKVAQPTKGLYIVNGKKVIIK